MPCFGWAFTYCSEVRNTATVSYGVITTVTNPSIALAKSGMLAMASSSGTIAISSGKTISTSSPGISTSEPPSLRVVHALAVNKPQDSPGLIHLEMGCCWPGSIAFTEIAGRPETLIPLGSIVPSPSATCGHQHSWNPGLATALTYSRVPG